MITKSYLSESEKKLARLNTFVLIGLTGRGKSSIIRFLTGDNKVKISSNNKTSCTTKSELFYSRIPKDDNEDIYLCFIDTAGFCDSNNNSVDKINYNNIKDIIIKNNCQIKGIFIVDDFQNERLNSHAQKIYECVAYLFPINKLWNYITIIFTHFYQQGDKSKTKVKNKEQKNISEILDCIMNSISKKISSIHIIDSNKIPRLYVNIIQDFMDNNYDSDDDDDMETYKKDLIDSKNAKNELYEEILNRVKMDPIYDEIKYGGFEEIIFRRSEGIYYDLYNATIETRYFYLKNKLISADILSCSEKKIYDRVNKSFYHIKNVGKAIDFGNITILSPFSTGIMNIAEEVLDIREILKELIEVFFS